MTPTEQKVLDFVGQQFLQGDTAGLTVHTKLLEAHIVDSLGVMVLLGFIEKELGVVVDLEDLRADSLQDVSTIAAMVDRKCGASTHEDD